MTIIVSSLSRAPDVAREHKVSHVVSLLDPGTAFPIISGLPEERRLRLSLHDVEEEADGLDVCGHPHMDQIIAFVRAWDAQAPILIHCYAGLSRSTATAFITACARNPDADEVEIAQTLRKSSSTASPNRRFIALADAALGRQGRMSHAIEAIGRGGNWWEIGEAKPFTMPSTFEPSR
jgi:predicted protein tyrosine phosphatase